MDRVLQKGNKLDMLKVLLTVGIVCRHATLAEAPSGASFFDAFTKGVVGVTEVCVPLFFAISGYLFFRGSPGDPNSSWFWGKLRSRFFSLVIPYIIACCVAWCCYFFAINWVPSMVSGFLGDDWKDPLFVFWKGPINLSLWFIRELIVVVILSPLVYLLVRYIGWWGLLVLGVLWAFRIGPAPLFFFSAGGCLGVRKVAPVDKWLLSPSRLVSTGSRAWNYFIYLYHYLLVVGVKKALVAALHPEGSAALIGIWIASVLLVLGLLSLLYYLMRKFAPRLAGIIVGGK